VAARAPDGTEVIVVDDGSAGGEIARMAENSPRVRIVRLPRRRGFCAAVNQGIEAAHGSVIEVLNDDTEVLSGWADAALAAFADPSVAAVAPLVLRWPGDRVDSAGDRYYVGGIAGKWGHGQAAERVRLRRTDVFGASASSAFYRRAALLQVGGFPEEFGAYFDDVDLSFRLHRAGYRILFEPGSRVLHRVSASYGGPRRRLLEQQSRNEERVFWRNLPLRTLARSLPQHLGVLAAKAWRRWHEGQLAPFLLGRAFLAADVPALLRHRRWLRGITVCPDPRAWQVEPRFWGASPPADFDVLAPSTGVPALRPLTAVPT
jgi:GT2 family glycosyltransferase